MWRWVITAILAAAGAWTAWSSLQRARLNQLAKGWTRVPGVIMDSRIDERTGLSTGPEDETTYVPVVAYTYEFDGATRIGRNLGLVEESYALPGRARARLEPFPKGAEIEVLVDPADPDNAALAGQASINLFAPILFFCLAGAVGLGLFGV